MFTSKRKKHKAHLMLSKLKDKAFKLRKETIAHPNDIKFKLGLKLFRLWAKRHKHFFNQLD